MNYLSACSGIEAATVAWHPLEWRPFAFAEIEKFPSAVLAHHYPTVPNLGDMTKFKEWPDAAINLLVGGTPCQSFSVAGLRKGLADPRGNLALIYLGIADRYRPEWIVWENVPGVLSSGKGRDFGAFLGALAELGYGWAYRVIDAQYVRVDGFGRAVPQRRRRVFVVGNLRDWRRAAAVLFEPESLSGNTAPRRETGQRVAPTISARPSGGGGLGTDFDCDGGLIADGFSASGDGFWRDGIGPLRAREQDSHENLIASTGDVSHCLNAGAMGRIDYETETMVAHALRAEGFDASEDGTGRGTPLVPVVADTITANWARSKGAKAGNQVGLLNPIIVKWAVRRLTPRECERLQGFPDDYTLAPFRGKPAADGPRYKALGNSMAVNVMRWIGRRIEMVSSLDVATLEAAE